MAVLNMRNKIIETASKMFLEKTYDEVSMRDIANFLNISVGNLTYHFKKKDDLAEAVILDMFERRTPKSPCNSLEGVDEWITLFEKSGDEDTFYFRNFEHLAENNKKIQDIQKEVFSKNMHFWRETLKVLCNAGILWPEEFEGQHDAFIHNFYLIKAHWREQSLVEIKLGAKKIDFRFRIWASLYPMLTENGKDIFKEKIKL